MILNHSEQVTNREVFPWDPHLEEVTTLLIQLNLREETTEELNDTQTLLERVDVVDEVLYPNCLVALSCFESDARAKAL